MQCVEGDGVPRPNMKRDFENIESEIKHGTRSDKLLFGQLKREEIQTEHRIGQVANHGCKTTAKPQTGNSQFSQQQIISQIKYHLINQTLSLHFILF